MILGRIGVTALADVCANLFAALLIVVLIAASSQHGAPPPPREIALDEAPQLSTRKPFGPQDVIRALWRRSLPDAAVSVDLMRSSLRVRAGGEETTYPLPLEAELPALPGPARLFVLDQTFYAQARAALARAGAAVGDEVSAPIALRASDGADWSPGFLNLSERQLDFPAFRADLARLLQGEAGSGGLQPGPIRTPAAKAPVWPEMRLSAWSRWLARGLVWPVLMAFILFVAAVEGVFSKGRR